MVKSPGNPISKPVSSISPTYVVRLWEQYLWKGKSILCVYGFCIVLAARVYNLSKGSYCYQEKTSWEWVGWSSGRGRGSVLEPHSEPGLLERLTMSDNYSEGKKYWGFNLPCPCLSLRILPRVSWQIRLLLANGRPALHLWNHLAKLTGQAGQEQWFRPSYGMMLPLTETRDRSVWLVLQKNN